MPEVSSEQLKTDCQQREILFTVFNYSDPMNRPAKRALQQPLGNTLGVIRIFPPRSLRQTFTARHRDLV